MIKKTIKSFLVLLIVLANNPVKADVSNISQPHFGSDICYVFNEYDYYIEIRKMTYEEAKTCYRISEDDYKKIMDIESVLLEMSNMSKEELLKEGYTEEKIKVLKEYKGSSLEKTPKLRIALASLTTWFNTINYSSSEVRVRYNWGWDVRPLIMSPYYYDTIAIRWKSYGINGSYISTTYSNGTSFVSYYDGNVINNTVSSTIHIGNSSSYIYTRFSEGVNSNNNTTTYWAKNGNVTIRLTGNNISKVEFGGAYNHNSSTAYPSISIDTNLGFVFSCGYIASHNTHTIMI